MNDVQRCMVVYFLASDNLCTVLPGSQKGPKESFVVGLVIS